MMQRRHEAATAFDEARLLVGPHGDAMVPGRWNVGPARYIPSQIWLSYVGMGKIWKFPVQVEKAFWLQKGYPVNVKVWKVFFDKL